jgi:hypothetical protein
VRDIFQKLAEQINGEGFLKAIPLLKTSHLKRYRAEQSSAYLAG